MSDPSSPTDVSTSNNPPQAEAGNVLSQSNEPFQIQAQNFQHPVIADIVASYQNGNFYPLLHSLNHKLIPRDFHDAAGFHPLHCAIAANNIQAVLILLDHFGVDVNILSHIQQTPLMTATFFGNLEIIRILIEHGANINHIDTSGFNALLYAVKQGNIIVFSYLLSQGADINIRDTNGCGVVHWAAFTNNVFMLRVLKRLGMEMEAVDKAGMTPLDRSIQGESAISVEYLVKETKARMTKEKIDQISNEDIQKALRKKFFPTKNEKRCEQLVEAFNINSRGITFSLYFVLWIMMMATMYSAVIQQKSFSLWTPPNVIFGLFFIAYVHYYLFKGRRSHSSYEMLIGDNDKELSTITPREEDISEGATSFEPLDFLLKSHNEMDRLRASSGYGYPSFLHEFADLIHKKKFKEALRFNKKDYCPDCMIKKPVRSCHVPQEKRCVSNFHHYSYVLKKSIRTKEHPYYFILLCAQQILMSMFLLQVWTNHFSAMKNKLVFMFEIAYVFWTSIGPMEGIVYLVIMVLWGFNLFFLGIELYGILTNLTYYEIFHPMECMYLMKTGIDRKGTYIKRFNNPFDKGAKQNFKDYWKARASL